MSYRQICKVIKSDSSSRKITIESEGRILQVDKVMGLDFRPGEFACYQTFEGSKKSLVVALNPEELKQIENSEHESFQTDSSGGGLGFPEPGLGVVPLDEEIFKSQLEKEQSQKSLPSDSLDDDAALEIISTLFAGEMTRREEEETVRKLFPMIASQKDGEANNLKESFFQKADEVVMRRLINEQTNREVHGFLNGMVNRIDDDKGHEDFFQSLTYYLERLKKIQQENGMSPKKMGVIFYPVYIYYVRKFTRAKIDAWIQSSKLF